MRLKTSFEPLRPGERVNVAATLALCIGLAVVGTGLAILLALAITGKL